MMKNSMIDQAVELLRKAADPVRIILFGSFARGDQTEDSDLDLLVVENGFTYEGSQDAICFSGWRNGDWAG
jgi:predicted nucleotidyltransferase